MTTDRRRPSERGGIDRCTTARPRVGARRGAIGALCLVCLLAASCGSRIRAARPAAPEPASPVVRGARDGLELWWWVVTEPRSRSGAAAPTGPTGPEPPEESKAPPPAPLEVVDLKFDLEDVLLPYVDRDVPMPAADRARWRAAGLRVISVPLDDLDRIQSHLRTVGPAQRQWLGERPEWTDAVTGPSFEEARPLVTGDATEVVSAGALRLLLRCWLAPAWDRTESGPGAVLRVELVPEHYAPEADRARRSGLEAPRAGESKPGPAGAPFRSLVAHLSLRDGEACLIVPDSPGADWTQSAPSEPGKLGPPSPPVPTVGEAMLSSAAFPDASRKVRVVLVLVARVPERFRLTSAGRPGP